MNTLTFLFCTDEKDRKVSAFHIIIEADFGCKNTLLSYFRLELLLLLLMSINF